VLFCPETFSNRKNDRQNQENKGKLLQNNREHFGQINIKKLFLSALFALLIANEIK
jgi:hypothetical protein